MTFLKQRTIRTTPDRLSITILILLLSFIAGNMLAQSSEPAFSEPDWSWRIFGDGFFGGSAIKRKSEILIDANWVNASWGVGLSYILKWPEKSRELDNFRIDIKTTNGSKMKVYAGLFTKAEANKVQDLELASEVTQEWQTYEFEVISMHSHTLTRFSPSSGSVAEKNNVLVISLFFMKPETLELGADTIIVRNLLLRFKDGGSYAYQWPY